MSDRSYAEVVFGPLSTEESQRFEAAFEAAFTREESTLPAPMGTPRLSMSALCEALDAANFEKSEDGPGFYKVWWEESTGGVEEFREKVGAILRSAGIGYDMSDCPCLGAWDACEVRWRPGMAEELNCLYADMAGQCVLSAASFRRLKERAMSPAELIDLVEAALGLHIPPLIPAPGPEAAE